MINTAQFNNNHECENSNTNEIKHFNLSQSDLQHSFPKKNKQVEITAIESKR